jgi:hypothetical protein
VVIAEPARTFPLAARFLAYGYGLNEIKQPYSFNP